MDLKKQHDEDRAEVAARFPGPDYREILALLHRLLQPARYLEIGVNTGKSFALAKSPTRAVGVDPEPRVTRIDNPNANLVKATSDAFFGELDRVRTNVSFDLVFIDGLHTFEQTLRDLQNAERYSHPGTLICIDDIYPLHARAAQRQRDSIFWTGDVWKILPILHTYRPDLRMGVVPCVTSGLLLIAGVNPRSTRLAEAEDQYVAEYMDVPFTTAAHDQALGMLPHVPNTAAAVTAFLETAGLVTAP